MIDAITGILRAMLAALGLLALVTPDATAPLLAAAAIAVALLIAAVIVARTHTRKRGPAAHPTRRAELFAPLTQSDPDAAGHVRRRGPSQVTAAA